MNETSRRLLSLAHGIAPAYAATPNVAAVVVGGSVAGGYADRWSDLELGVFWITTPTEHATTAAALAAGATERRVFPDASPPHSREEDFVVGDVKVDVVHLTVDRADRIVGAVTAGDDTTILGQSLVSAVRGGVPLHGFALLARWQAQAASYPEALARAMIAEHLAFGPHWWLEMLAERDDLAHLYELFVRVERLILGVLYGLNRVYAPSASLKWAIQGATGLSVAPPDLAWRLKRLFRAEPREGVREARRLIEETVALVETHRPEVDTAPVRARLSTPPRGRPSDRG